MLLTIRKIRFDLLAGVRLVNEIMRLVLCPLPEWVGLVLQLVKHRHLRRQWETNFV